MRRKLLGSFLLGFIAACILLSFKIGDSFKSPIIAQVLDRKSYISAYDGRCKNPYYVYEFLDEKSIDGSVSRYGMEFKEDVNLPNIIRSNLSDYKGSGFDRGHLCPAGDCTYSKEAMIDSFYLSNISPQVPKFNRGYWKKLEEHVRTLVTEYKRLEVITGPLYLPHNELNGNRYVKYQVIGKNDVAVPTHFFKIVRSKDRTWAWILPNEEIDKSTPFIDFEVTLDKVERVSGIVF